MGGSLRRGILSDEERDGGDGVYARGRECVVELLGKVEVLLQPGNDVEGCKLLVEWR